MYFSDIYNNYKSKEKIDNQENNNSNNQSNKVADQNNNGQQQPSLSTPSINELPTGDGMDKFNKVIGGVGMATNLFSTAMAMGGNEKNQQTAKDVSSIVGSTAKGAAVAGPAGAMVGAFTGIMGSMRGKRQREQAKIDARRRKLKSAHINSNQKLLGRTLDVSENVAYAEKLRSMRNSPAYSRFRRSMY